MGVCGGQPRLPAPTPTQAAADRRVPHLPAAGGRLVLLLLLVFALVSCQLFAQLLLTSFPPLTSPTQQQLRVPIALI